MKRRALALPLIFGLLILAMHGLKGQGNGSENGLSAQPQENQILFFQGSAHCQECEMQAQELERLRRKIPELKIVTYDLDKDRLVADRYNVWIVPTLIVNGKKHEGLVTAERLESIIRIDPNQGSLGGDRFLDTLPFAFSLAAGFLTGLEPCALAFSGMVVLFIMGSSAAERRGRSGSLAAALIFALVRAFVFALLGFAVSALGASAGNLRLALLITASVVAFLVGWSYLGWIDLPMGTLAPGSKTLLKLRRGHLTPILLGLVFGFAVLPCATPVMASLLAFAASTQRIGIGVTSLFLFGAGLSTPVVGFACVGKAYWDRSRLILQQGKKVRTALGVSLVVFSLYLLYAAF